MILRLLQLSLFTTLASDQPSSINELLPNAVPLCPARVTPTAVSARQRVFGMATIGALAIGCLGAVLFLGMAAQLFRGGEQLAVVTGAENATNPMGAMAAQTPDKKSKLMAFATQHPGHAPAGKLVFLSKGCVECHDHPGAGGGMGPDLLGVSTRYSKEALMLKILQPRAKSGMPTTFADDLSEEEFADLAAYLQTEAVPLAVH